MLHTLAPFLLALSATSTLRPVPVPVNPSLGALTIQCPGLAKVYCHESTDPSITGMPTTSGECDPNIPATLTYTDTPVSPPCDAQRFEAFVFRRWTATDSCGNTASCDQRIHVVKDIWNFDIKAPSCPNPFNLGANGMISMTLVGTSQHDVTTIDPSTIRIWTEDCQGGPVAPIRYNYEDKATPWPGGPACGCHTLGADGILDLNFHFRRADVENGLHLGSYPHFSYVRIFVTAQTFDGCGILGSECVRVP
jgi:hypothetical protein